MVLVRMMRMNGNGCEDEEVEAEETEEGREWQEEGEAEGEF